MEFRQSTGFYVTVDDIIEKSNSSEQRLLIRPLVMELINLYQPLYNGAVGNEKQAKAGELVGTPEGNKELAIWQGKRRRQKGWRRFWRRFRVFVITESKED